MKRFLILVAAQTTTDHPPSYTNTEIGCPFVVAELGYESETTGRPSSSTALTGSNRSKRYGGSGSSRLFHHFWQFLGTTSDFSNSIVIRNTGA